MSNLTQPTPPTPNVPGWRVTGQTPTSRLDQNGRPTTGWLVSFQTARGEDGSVYVQDRFYTPEFVRQAIVSQVERMDGVAGLTG